MSDFVAVLDIGTSKTTCLAAEVGDGELLDILGMTSAPSLGVQRGTVVSATDAGVGISRAVEQLATEIGREVSRLIVAVGGAHVEGMNAPGIKLILPRGRYITHQDVLEVINHSRAIVLPDGREPIQALPREFRVDGVRNVRKPIGMGAGKLEVTTYIGTGASSSLREIDRAVEAAGFKVDQYVVAPLAAGIGALTQEELDAGAVVVDIGAGVTDVAIFVRGSIAFLGTVAACSSHVTRDVATLLKTTTEEAERLKLEHGCAIADLVTAKESVEVHQSDQDQSRPMQRHVLAEIIEARTREIAKMVKTQMEGSGFLKEVTGGVVLTGGGSQLPGIDQAFASVLGVDKVRVANLDPPGSAVSLGLARFALQCYDELVPASPAGLWKDRVRSLFSFINGR